VRQFASSGFRIWNLSVEAKLVYTCFGLFSLAALAVSALFYEDLVGHGTSGVRAYYAGEAPRAAEAPAVPPAGGPAIALPEPEAAAPLTVAVSYRKLLEVTHFHLFTVPVFLLIVAHLFMLTGLAPRAKAIWIAAAWLSAALHLGAPWLVRYGGGGWAWLYAASGAALAVTSTVLTAAPIISMWRPRAARA
jgi:hypothetical protein